VDALKGLAPGLGLDAAAFNECLDSGKYASEVGKDVEDGTSYGVEGTPAFFINGLLVPGALPFASFKSVLDAALAAQASSAVPGAAGSTGG
jgi:protein-disulfide isomerase